MTKWARMLSPATASGEEILLPIAAPARMCRVSIIIILPLSDSGKILSLISL